MNIQDQSRSAIPPGFKFRLSLEDHVGPIIWLAWSPNGRLLASCSADESVNIWDVTTGRVLNKLKLHKDAVLSLAWSPDGRVIASGSLDASIVIYDHQSSTPLTTLSPKHGSINDLVWSHNGKYLAAGFEAGRVKVFNKRTYEEAALLGVSRTDIASILWTKNDEKLITSSHNGKVKLWNTKTWKHERTLIASDEAVFDLALSPDQMRLAAALADGRIVVWDTVDWEVVAEVSAHSADVTCVRYSYNGDYLASKSFDGSVKLWDTATGNDVGTLSEPSQGFWLSGLAFHPSQLTLATLGAGDTIVRIWDLEPSMLVAGVDASPPKKQSLRKESPPPALKLNAPPHELVKACLDGECVVYVGAGLAAKSGLPMWNEFVQNLVGWGEKNSAVDQDTAESLREALATGNSAQVADLLISEINSVPHLQPSLNAYLAETFVNATVIPTNEYSTLSDIPFAAALTTNFDNLLESAFKRPTGSLTPHDTEKLLSLLQSPEFFILKLFGVVERPETVMLSPAQFEASVSDNVMFSRFIESLFVSKTLFFVGASLEGIEFYLKALKLGTSHITRKHFALVAVTGGTAWKVKADILARRYGIHVIPFTPSPDFAEVGTFLEGIRDRVAKISQQTSSGEIPVPALAKAPTLKSVELSNIGPFTNLSLKFDSRWNVLLGDNGVGKSSILKAIAIGFAGEDARSFADRSVKTGSSSASITLEFADDDSSLKYITRITLTDSGAEVRSFPDAPIRAKKCLALGFPALRAMLWERGPDIAITGRERPTAEDLIPLIDGRPDPRLDNLRSWLVQLDHVIGSTDTTVEVKNRYEKLRRRFFKIIEQLTPGLKVKYKRVDPKTKKVLIETDDGVIPIELVSQGTTSLLGWIGVFLQRYFDVYGNLADRLDDYSLVLVDEIDAHMHPLWQRTVVSTLSKLFPKAQFIVTTHSPLIVGGLDATQVQRFARGEDGTVVPMEVLPDMTLGYSDQILTSDLFGLETALDETTVELQSRYHELLVMKKRTPKEEEEFNELSETIFFRVPPAFGTYQERRQQMMNQAGLLKLLGEQLVELSPDDAASGHAMKTRGENFLSKMEKPKK